MVVVAFSNNSGAHRKQKPDNCSILLSVNGHKSLDQLVEGSRQASTGELITVFFFLMKRL